MMIRLEALLHDMWWRFRLRWLRSQFKAETEAEFRFHLEMDAMELRRGGLEHSDSEKAAETRFGDIERVRQDCLRAAEAGETYSNPTHTQPGEHMWNDILHDVRYGLRAPLCANVGETPA